MIERFINAKSILAFKLALATSPVMFVVETYLFNDWAFLVWVIILVCIDWVWALYLAWKTKTISKEGFQKGGEKLAQYATLLILGHILLNIKSGGEGMVVFSYMTMLIHGYIISLEAISILEKQATINAKLVPVWLLERFKNFRDTGKIDKKENEKD